MNRGSTATGAMPACAGIGLRAPHMSELLASRPAIGWLEVHSENYFAPGGRAAAELERVRRDYPLSLHGVGLSLGSADPLDQGHLEKLMAAVRHYSPLLVSDHLCWTSVDGRHFHDLLPLPYTQEALEHLRLRVLQVQDYLGRQLLLENVSSYLEFEHSTIPEWEFLRNLAELTGCGILLDVNNVYVSAVNHGFDARTYIDAMPAGHVEEIHLAGHTPKQVDGVDVLIDSHDQPVSAPVWDLYVHALERLGRKPTLIEWDSRLPALETLLAESAKAQTLLERRHAAAA